MMRGLWKPIAELTDWYQQPLWIASPKLIHGDSNPLGISDGFWQDDAGDMLHPSRPGENAWKAVGYDMCNDEFQTVYIAKDDVTHFLIPEGPWTPEELETLEQG